MARAPQTHGGVTEKTVRLPDKLYFKIGEVCEITGVKQHVLRYWESEFKMLSPQRARSKQRLYRKADVENILRIKRLLKEEGFTISGAKKILAREKKKNQDGQADLVSVESLCRGIKEELLDLKKMLEEDIPADRLDSGPGRE